MGLFDLLAVIQDANNAKEIVQQSLEEALSTMESMVANEGQTSVFENYVTPEFEAAASASPEDGWPGVDIGDYMDFMGEIVEAGNQIMEAGYEYAMEVMAGLEDYDEDEIAELGDEAEVDL